MADDGKVKSIEQRLFEKARQDFMQRVASSTPESLRSPTIGESIENALSGKKWAFETAPEEIKREVTERILDNTDDLGRDYERIRRMYQLQKIYPSDDIAYDILDAPKAPNTYKPKIPWGSVAGNVLLGLLPPEESSSDEELFEENSMRGESMFIDALKKRAESLRNN